MTQSHPTYESQSSVTLETMQVPRRVVKVGGSCLENPQLTSLLTDWFTHQTPAENWVIVGGGECIEAMRTLSRRYSLKQSEMHWRCIRLLDATWEILTELFPQWIPIHSPEIFRQTQRCEPQPATYIVRVQSFYSRPDEPQVHATATGFSQIPVGWETTTDSLAAFLATIIGAAELVLIKSCAIPSHSPVELQRLGIVDDAFPSILPKTTKLRLQKLGS